MFQRPWLYGDSVGCLAELASALDPDQKEAIPDWPMYASARTRYGTRVMITP
jgi:hypothetical protein